MVISSELLSQTIPHCVKSFTSLQMNNYVLSDRDDIDLSPK